MSGPELLAAETVAATATAAETAAAAEAISAAIAAAEAEAAILAAEAAAAEGATAASAELFGGGALDPLQAAISAAEQEAAAINMAQAYTGQGLADPFEKFLQYGVDADAPGAAMRSLQSGFANDPLNTLKSLPQYLGMPAGGPSAIQTMYGANIAKQMLGGSGRPQSTTSTTQIRPGQQVNMSQPMSLLAPQIRRRRGISLL
jgi:hypothetical protein